MTENVPWSEGILWGMDTETTGPDPLIDRMVSAAIVIDDPSKDDPIIFKWLIDPGIPIAMEATAVHGISNEEVQAKGQDESTAIIDILNTIEWIIAKYGKIPCVMVNVTFDFTLINNAIKRLNIGEGLKVNFPIIDTLVCDRALDKYRRGRRTLTATSAAYGVVIRGAHQADGDIIASIALARAMAKRFPNFANADLRSLQVMQKLAANQRAEQFQEYRRRDGKEPNFVVAKGWPILEDINEVESEGIS